MYDQQQFNYSRPRYQIGATEVIIIINVLLFIIFSMGVYLKLNFGILAYHALVLHMNIPQLELANYPFTIETGAYWQLLTSVFMHGGLLHIFFNMYGLFIFGKPLEARWGKAKFLGFYLVTGVLANAASVLFFKFIPFGGNQMEVHLLGASGAIFGIILAFAGYNPNAVLLLYFIIPLKVKWAVLIFAGMEIIAEVTQAKDGIAHITHLFGFLFGYLYLLVFFKINAIKEMFFQRKNTIYYQ